MANIIKIHFTQANNQPKAMAGGFKIPALSQRTLAQSIYLAGVLAPLPLCSGLGRCGLCRVRFLSPAPQAFSTEQAILGNELVQLGWRLGCKHLAQAGMQLELPDFVRALQAKAQTSRQAQPHAPPGIQSGASAEHILLKQTASNPPDYPNNPPHHFSKLVLAVDFGTTSLHWQAFGYAPLQNSWLALQAGRELNPQMGAGSEVMSRLYEASLPGGSARLAQLAQNALQRIIATLEAQPHEICIAANPAMTCLFLGLNATSLASAPYHLPLPGNAVYQLPNLPPVYIPPLLAPFIGGDISAGICAIVQGEYEPEQQSPKYPFLMADLGTNGEFVLAKSANQFYAASIPLGPALEGIGLSCGGLAGSEGEQEGEQAAEQGGQGGLNSVITAFSLRPQGITSSNIPLHNAKSISGTGYFSLIHLLLKNGVLNPDGSFAQGGQGGEHSSGHPGPETTQLQRLLSKQIKPSKFGPVFKISSQLELSAQDVEELLKVKAAFSLVVKVLLEAASLSSPQLKTVYLAGSLGLHASPLDLEGLGFLPAGIHTRIKAIGNSSLAGAGLMLQNPKAKQTALAWAKQTQLISLQDDAKFMQQYLCEMAFKW